MGNCLEKNYSSSEESDEREIISSDETSSERQRRNRLASSSSTGNRYTSLVEEMSNSSASLNLSNRSNGSHYHHNYNHHHPHRTSSSSSITPRDSSSTRLGGNGLSSSGLGVSPSLNNYLSQSYAGFGTGGSTLIPGLSSTFPSSTIIGGGGGGDATTTSSQQVFYLTPNTQRTADQLTEEEQVKLLKRMTLIQQLPTGSYDENKKNKECVICMIDFEKGDTIKYLPCMHTFHQSCIDTWLLRSLICPSCMEPVDAGLLAAYE